MYLTCSDLIGCITFIVGGAGCGCRNRSVTCASTSQSNQSNLFLPLLPFLILFSSLPLPPYSPGILSFFAVQAGARKVYAIEASNMAICCLELVKSNRFSEKIVVIPGKVEEVSPPYTHRQTISNIETNNNYFFFFTILG